MSEVPLYQGSCLLLSAQPNLADLKLFADDVFQGAFCPIEQWLQRHPEAGSSWPSWPRVSHSSTPRPPSLFTMWYRGTSLLRKRQPPRTTIGA